MLAADAGLDWSFEWDAATYDDWSWTFGDDWTSAAPGDASGEDAWWVGDLPWDLPAGGEDDSPPPIWESETSEPAAPTASGDAEVTGTEWPTPAESVADQQTVTPDTDPDIDEMPVDEPAIDEPAIDEVPAIDAVPIEGIPVDDSPAADTPVADATNDPVDTEPAVTLPDPADDPGLVTDDESSDPQDGPADGDDEAVFELPVFEPPVTDTGDHGQPVTARDDDQPTDSGGIAIADAPQPVPIAAESQPAPVASPSLPAPAGAAPAPSHDGVASRFRSWGGLLFQSPGRSAGMPDGASTGILADGQPGSTRSRIRLPFRPFS